MKMHVHAVFDNVNFIIFFNQVTICMQAHFKRKMFIKGSDVYEHKCVLVLRHFGVV